MPKVLALNVNGDITYCSVPPEMRGKGRCNHVEHQMENESVEEFISRIENSRKIDVPEVHVEDRVEDLAAQMDAIAGTKLTKENFAQVISKLEPQQIADIAAIGFENAQYFDIPINDEGYQETNWENKIYFSDLATKGISGNKDAIAELFGEIGTVPGHNGEPYEIKNNYKKGLTPEEYFQKQFTSRDSVVNKSVGTAKPGYCVDRRSLVEIMDDETQKLVKIHWEELQVGDTFINDSQVLELEPWKVKPCYTMKIKGMEWDPITVSEDHLVVADILVNNKLVTHLEHSALSRDKVMEKDQRWICAKDIYEFHRMGAMIFLSGNALEYIKPVGKREVRCISTSTGFFETNGMMHHNTARKLFYAMSDTQVVSDCGGPYIDAMHCRIPEGHVCEKCAHLTQGGEVVHEGDLVGGWISSNASEGMTQLSMKQKHVSNADAAKKLNVSNTVIHTLDAWGGSQIIQDMREANSTEEMRQILFEGLKACYDDAGIKLDDFNIQMIAKRMTSYKRERGVGLRPVRDGERCDIVSLKAVGSHGNMLKSSELESGYNILTKEAEYPIKRDAANEIMR